MTTLGVLLLVVCAALCAEMAMVRRWESRLRVRIHVGGTRGKSSVVRLVAAAMRKNGYRVIAKVTGEHPTLILPDGSAEQILRRGPARVQEQVRFLRRAVRLDCDAAVVECMSLNPRLQLLESRVLRPTVSVLTNILDDHREEFGSMPGEQAEALCAFFPFNARLVSGEVRFAELVATRAGERGTRVIPPDIALSGMLKVSSPAAHAENLLLALAVCDELGIERDKALQAMIGEAESAASPVFRVKGAGIHLTFLNAFPVNDVTTARRFLAQWSSHIRHQGPLAVILNTRADRPMRSVQFARWCSTLPGVERIIISGTHCGRTRRELRSSGIDAERITQWSSADVRNPVPALQKARVSSGCLVVGVGNIGGDGFTILEGIQRWSQKRCS